MALSIILADDHPLVHRGIHAVLEREPDFSIVGMAADGLETVRLTERLKPAILVLDLMMPGLSGLEALRILRERSPRTRIVILSMYSSSAFIARALQNGAIGYVLKGCPEQHLVSAVREAAAGRRFLSPPAAEGKTNAEIAARLNISQRTVENHRATLMKRLGLQNQTEMIRHALRHGLIPPDEAA